MSLELSQLVEDSGRFAGSDLLRTEHLQYSPDQGFTDASKSSLAETATDGIVNRWHYSSESSEFTFIQTVIRPGFEVNVTKALFNEEVVCSALDHRESLVSGFCLSGRSIARFNCINKDLEMQEGHHGMFYTSRYSGIGQIQTGIPHLQVTVRLETDQLQRIFDNESQLLPTFVKQILDHNPDEDLYQTGSVTQAMLMAVRQIINCRQRGLARKLFLEGKALELISYQMENFAMADGGGQRPKAIHPEDRRKTEYVHNLLVSNIAKPPHLEELAKAVGMSHTKLNRCFKKVFGSTVFECLRNERLLRAREMLEHPGITVTEVAYAMGYSSPSHFSRAYKKHFGMLPSINPE